MRAGGGGVYRDGVISRAKLNRGCRPRREETRQRNPISTRVFALASLDRFSWGLGNRGMGWEVLAHSADLSLITKGLGYTTGSLARKLSPSWWPVNSLSVPSCVVDRRILPRRFLRSLGSFRQPEISTPLTEQINFSLEKKTWIKIRRIIFRGNDWESRMGMRSLCVVNLSKSLVPTGLKTWRRRTIASGREDGGRANPSFVGISNI